LSCHSDKEIWGKIHLWSGITVFILILETFGFGMNFSHALQKSILKGSNYYAKKYPTKNQTPKY